MGESIKLAAYNLLSESEAWDLEPGGVTKPPTLTVLSGLISYTNISGAANHALLLKDGDQNLPIFTNGNIDLDFGVAYIPKLICFINHNVYDSGSKIEIYAGPNAGALVLRDTIESPNRSIDLFYPLRFNDAWLNSTSVNQAYWRFRLLRGSGAAYIGEIVIASDYFSFDEWTPQSDYSLNMAFDRRKATHEFYSGESTDHDIKPPVLNFDLTWIRKAIFDGNNLYVDWLAQHMAGLNKSPNRQVLVWRDNRVCLFGKLNPEAGIGWNSDESFTPRFSFTGEYPRRFYRDELD